MKLIFTFLFAALQLFCIGQEKNPTKKYILLRIEVDYDKENLRSYYKIIPDGWCVGADEVYGLQTYNWRRGAENKSASIYHDRTDTSQKFYNYFYSATEALNFMGAYGWNLASTYINNFPETADHISTIASRVIFCFSKEP